MKAIYFDCYSGISGDMILGALIDAGLNLGKLKNELKKLRIDGWNIKTEKVKRCGITATKFKVIVDTKKDKSRHLSEILEIIDKSKLSPNQKNKSKEIFEKIGNAEAKIHNTKHNDVHFHEIGSLDAIIDIVGAVVAMDLLNIKKAYSSEVVVGKGTIKISHGEVPIPAPATSEILKGIPLKNSDIEEELTTPTGAAILTTLCQSFTGIPNGFKITQIGYGAGSREYPGKTNFLRILIGEIPDELSDLISETVYLITTEIDDMNPEIFSSLMEGLFNIGCLDAHFISVYMKKNRPGTKLEILSDFSKKDEIINYIFKNTSTFGIRVEEVHRYCLKREMDFVNTKYGKITVKKGFLGDKIIKVSPEYESCKVVAKENNVELIKVYNEVLKKIKDL